MVSYDLLIRLVLDRIILGVVWQTADESHRKHVMSQALCGVNCNLMHSTSWLCPGDSMNRQV